MKRREFLKSIAITATLPVMTSGLVSCSNNGPVLPESLIKDGQTILFIGDSITQNSGYVNYIETFLVAKYPEKHFNIIGLGLSSETVCGLTEPKHPYPRPNIHDRLQRVLDRTQPDVVVACYGMNDAIYHPFDDNRFTAFKAGITMLIKRITNTGAELYLLTPPPFDPVVAADRLVDENAERFGFDATWKGYDDVLKTYGEWVLQQSDQNVKTINIHTPMNDFLAANRKTNPDYYLARDGVHPGAVGHWIMAQTILKAWNEYPVEERASVFIKNKKVTGQVENVTFPGGDVRFDWHIHVPVSLQSNEVRKVSGLDARLVRPVLQVEQSGVAGYKCYMGDTMFQSFTKEELEKGVELGEYPSFSPTRRGAKLMNLVRQRRSLYDHALLEDIGHTLPQHQKPLSLAEAEERKPELDNAIITLSRLETIKMRMVPYI